MKHFEGVTSFRKAASTFFSLSEAEQQEFCSLNAEMQARCLFVPDRKYKRFLRECPTSGDTSYVSNLMKPLLKKGKKYERELRRDKAVQRMAREQGFTSYGEMREADDAAFKARVAARSKDKQKRHYQGLAAQIENEERKGII